MYFHHRMGPALSRGPHRHTTLLAAAPSKAKSAAVNMLDVSTDWEGLDASESLSPHAGALLVVARLIPLRPLGRSPLRVFSMVRDTAHRLIEWGNQRGFDERASQGIAMPV